MKSEKVREFIDGCMEHLNIVITNENDQPLLKAGMSDHAKQQLRTAMTHAA